MQEELTFFDYGARFYDPVVARWTSIDPMAEEYDEWSPYNYTLNNPATNIDPNGMWTANASGLFFGGGEDELNYKKEQIGAAVARGDGPDKPIVLDNVVITSSRTNDILRTTAFLILDVIQFDLATPDPSDAAWPKWVGEGIAGSTAISVLHLTAPKVTLKPGIVKSNPPIPSAKDLPWRKGQSPGKGWTWKGKGNPESGKGNWVNDKGQKLHPDFDHPDPKGPHWGLQQPSGEKLDIFPNGKVVPNTK